MRRKYDQKFTTEEISNVECYLKEARIDEYKIDPKVFAAFKQYCELLGKDTFKSPRDFSTLKIRRVAKKHGVELDRKIIQQGVDHFCWVNIFVRCCTSLRRKAEIDAGLRPDTIEKGF